MPSFLNSGNIYLYYYCDLIDLIMDKTLVSIFRDASIGDCTNNGLSSRVTSGLLFWNCSREEAIKWCNENDINPNLQFIINKRILWGEDHSFAEPLIKPDGLQMFGGNFIYTSNGYFYRFDKVDPHVGKIKEMTNRPIPIHDRFESQKMYDAMSI